MQFNTFSFALFFLCFFMLYYAAKKHNKIQNIMLLAGSYLFYAAADYRFLFILLIPTALDYLFAIMIQHGSVEVSQRIKSSAAILGGYLLLIFPRYEAVSFKPSNYTLNMTIDWSNAVNPHGYKLLALIIILLAAINLALSAASKWNENNRKKLFVTISIIISLSILCVFKYFNFFTGSFITLSKKIFGTSGEPFALKILLPVGISFFIFKSISYVVDVYRNDVDSSKSFINFATYLAFFPQLLAGPIERAGNLLPQLNKVRPGLKYNEFREAAWLFIWGMFKKAVIADNVAIIVNEIFGPYDTLAAPVIIPDDGLRMLLGIYAFTIQIFCDFSGYTDMSRGIARFLGFKTMMNFELPYFSITPGEFWRRWHISLSTWLRDYLYIPLGGNRSTSMKTGRNQMITMLLGGLWHGASWTFVLWGGYHGILLVIYRTLGIEKSKYGYLTWKKFINGFITLNLVAFGWLLFRAENMTTVLVFIKAIFLHPFSSPETLSYLLSILSFSWFLILFQIVQLYTKNLDIIYRLHWFVRFNIWLYLLFSIMVISPVKTPEFIYFAF